MKDNRLNTDLDPALDPRLDQLSRRAFVRRVGAASLAATAVSNSGPAAAQEKSVPLVSAAIHYPSGGQQIDAYLTHPEGNHHRGGVVVIHEIFGLNDHIRSVARRAASAGYTVLAPNFFTREGAPPAQFQDLMPFVGKIPDSQILGDLAAAVEFLRARPDSNGRAGVIGFCWGGYYAMLASAETPHLNAAIAYYGRIRLAEKTANKPHAPIEMVAQMKAPLLGNFGAEDRGITPADAAALREELKKHHKPGEIYEYEGAGHAFNNDTRESYNAAAAKLAWSRTLGWLKKYLA